MSGNKNRKLSNAVVCDDLEKFRYKYCRLSSRTNLRCSSSCHFKVTFDIQSFESIHWFHMKCKICRNTWYVCRNCSYQKRPYVTKPLMKRHTSKFHRKASISEISVESNEIDKEAVNEKIHIDYIFSRVQNNNYFEKDKLADGPTYLVGLSQFHLQDIKNLIPKDDVLLQIKLAHFFKDLSEQKTCQIVDIFIRMSNARHLPEKNLSCKIPCTRNEVKNLFKNTNTSIYKNLPYPSVTEKQNHAYISIREIISDALARGNDLPLQIEDDLDKHVEIKIMRWSDDFEPINGTKSNRGSGILISTITLLGGRKHEKSNTYILGVGKKGDTHQQFERIVQTDIEDINNDNTGMYSTQLEGWIKPKIILVAYLADSPERHTLCGLTRGNGNFTLRWGYVFDKRHILSSLPSCEKCLKKLMKGNMATDIICKKCLNWDVSDVSHELTDFPPPEFYPSDTGDVTKGKIKTKIVSFSNLKEVCRLTHETIKSGCWLETNADVYLTVHGINPDLIFAIIERAMEIQRGNV